MEFGTDNEGIDKYDMHAGEEALADRIRRIGMCRLASLAGHVLLPGNNDKYADLPSILSRIPTGEVSGDPEEENALITDYFEQSEELLRSRWSIVQALAQRLLPRRSLNAVEIAEVLATGDA